jgi:AmiR/NasT family two-component response regulator
VGGLVPVSWCRGKTNVSQRRPRGTTGAFCPGNVIDLDRVRRHRSVGGWRTVFYLNEQRDHVSLLTHLNGLKIVDIHSNELLTTKLLLRTADLVLVESAIQWTCPIEVIQHLQHRLSVPIVMICDRKSLQENRSLVKQAYAAGVCDTLFAPLEIDELSETLHVLLKFQKAYAE